MSGDIFSDKVLALLHETTRANDGSNRKIVTGRVQTALIPVEIFDPLCAELNDLLKGQKDTYHERRLIATDGQIRAIAAKCEACDLCKTCSGEHYTYSRDFDKSFPPGQEKCFAFLEKEGQKLRAEPCTLCEEHDLMLRKAHGSTAKARSVESRLHVSLQQLYAKRKQLFDTYEVSVHVFPAV